MEVITEKDVINNMECYLSIHVEMTVPQLIYSVMNSNNLKKSDLYTLSNKDFFEMIGKSMEVDIEESWTDEEYKKMLEEVLEYDRKIKEEDTNEK